MPAKSPKKSRTRPPRDPQPTAAEQISVEPAFHQDEETAADPSVTPPSSPEIYQAGDLWDEREAEFFQPYLEMLQRRGSTDGGQDDRAADRPSG